MPLNLTRKELYDLVWTKSRSQIAKQLGISDVRVGKVCRDMNVPAPPRGYWANLAGRRRKRKYVKPPLTYNLAERIEEDHAALWSLVPNFDPKDFDQPVPPSPVMPSSLDETLERYRLLVYKAPMPKATRGLHSITQKFVTEDERLAKLARPYSWEKQKFESPEGKALLQGLNQLLWMLTDLGLNPSSRGYRDIRMWISRGDHSTPFEVRRAEANDTHGRRRAKGGPLGFEFWFDTQDWERRSKKPALIFQAFTRAVLRSIALLIIEYWEKGFRESVKRTYDWRVSERKEAVRQAELARERERQRCVAEFQARLESREKLLQNAISGAARSDKIRSLIQVLDEKIGQRREDVRKRPGNPH